VTEIIEIPARKGKAEFVKSGQHIKVINTLGAQVVDTWAFSMYDQREFMSMEHTRSTLTKTMAGVGEHLYTNRRRPILTLVEDTSPGIHDTLMFACDVHRYALLGCAEYHDNCTDNLATAMFALGLSAPQTPCPLNLFMNIPWAAAGTLAYEPPKTKPGDYFTFIACMDLVIVFSACPQDMVPINGENCVPTEAHFQVLPNT
jgi:hypothetical protein